MRLLYLTDRLSHRGGAPHHLLDVIAAMASHHSVTVAAASKDAGIELPPGVNFRRIAGLRSLTKSMNGLSELLDDADLVHLQNVMNPRAIAQATARPCVATIQDHRTFCPGPGKTLPSGDPCDQAMNDDACSECLPDSVQRQSMLNLTQARHDALLGARQLVVLSHYMARELARVGSTNATVIPPPVPVGPPKTHPGHGFLLAGRLVHHKAPQWAHTAWKNAELDQPLRVAGLGPGSTDLDGAEALGWLSRSELREEMANARALIFPARWQEPFGIAGAEALAMGTPVVVMPSGGTDDWARKGTIAVDSVERMTEALTDLANRPEAALKLGKEGSEWVAERFSPDRVHRALHGLYDSVV